MARARNIKPGLFKNEILGEADPLFTLLFVGLWTLADREGRLEDRPVRIKGELFPYRDGMDVAAMLTWLAAQGFIQRYQANGKALIQILQFAKHQTPHGTEKDSDLPGENGLFTVHTRGKNGYATGDVTLVNRGLTVKAPSDNSLTPDSGFLIPDSGYLTPEHVPAAPAPPPAAKPKKQKAAKTPLPEDFGISDRVIGWAKEKGFGQLQEHLESFRGKATANGYTYVDWDAAFMGAIREDWAKLRAGQRPASTVRAPQQSFAERDRDAGMQRWEEMTGRVHPDRQQPGGVVIDMPTHQLTTIGGRS